MRRPACEAVMLEISTLIEAVEAKAKTLTTAEGPSEIFHTLLDGAALAAPRAGLYLVRKGVLKGWGTRGYSRLEAEQFPTTEIEDEEAWPASLIRPDGPESAVRPDALTEAHAFALRVGGRVLAVVEIARDPGQDPWHPEILGLLMRVAEIRLELDLARRKIDRLLLERASEQKAATATAPPPQPVDKPAAVAESPEPSPGPSSALEPLPPAGDDPEEEDPARVAARRFARLVATDIRLYNEEAVMLGRKHRDLEDRLKDQIDRGAEAFLRRYPDLGDSGETILRDAYIQVLAAGDATLFAEGAG
jgi:hypothetical protein